MENEKIKKTLLSVKNLKISFRSRGQYFQAVNDASFDVEQGDFFGIIGESGSGKTSIGRSIVRLNIPSSGEIVINNRLVSNRKISRKNRRWLSQKVQMIFQDPTNAMNPIKTIAQIVSEPLAINRSILKKSFNYINNILKIRKYFLLDFTIDQFKLTSDFQLSYLSKLKQKMHDFNLKLVGINNLANVSADDILTNLSELLQDYIDKMLLGVKEIYQFSENYQKFLDDYTNNFYSKLKPIDLELLDAIKFAAIKKKNFRFSSQQQIKQKEIVELKQEKNNLKNSIKTNNISYYKNRLLSWKANVQNNIRNYLQLTHFSKNNFDYAFNKIKLIAWKSIRHYYSLFSKNSFFQKETFDLLIDLITNKLELIYTHLSNAVIESEKSFFQENSDKNLILQKNEWYKLIAYATHRSLISDDTNNLLSVITELAERIVDKSQINNLGVNINEFSQLVTQVKTWIDEVLSTARQENLQLSKQFHFEINKIERKIRKNKADLIVLKRQRSDSEIYQTKESYRVACQNVKKINLKRKNYVKNDYLNRGIKFRQQKKITEDKILKLDDEILQLRSSIDKEIKKIKKMSFSKFKSSSSQKKLNLDDFQSVWQTIVIKLRTIDSFYSEYDSFLDNTFLYRRLFQWKWLFPWLLLRKLISIEKQKAVFNVLQKVGLRNEHANRYPHEFSGGQKQRIVIARALITNPEIIVADEPISALDVSIQAQIINVMSDLTKQLGVTFLFIAHDLSMVNYVCNKVVIIHRGRILEKGNVNEIFAHPIHPYTRSLFAAVPKLSRIHVNLAKFNEKFIYDKDYTAINTPFFNKVEGDVDHEVLATRKQFDEWCKQAQQQAEIN